MLFQIKTEILHEVNCSSSIVRVSTYIYRYVIKKNSQLDNDQWTLDFGIDWINDSDMRMLNIPNKKEILIDLFIVSDRFILPLV